MLTAMSQAHSFFDLTPDRVLSAAEALGLRCTGRCMALNSLENRVYEVEIELDSAPKTRWDAFRVLKFYRPGRWSKQQILEEHQFLKDLAEGDIPVVEPLINSHGETLFEEPQSTIFYSLYRKVGGRLIDELDKAQLERLGRLIARIHMIGASKPSQSRVTLSADSYGRKNLEFLIQGNFIPAEIVPYYSQVVGQLCNQAESVLAPLPRQRIHGDLHVGNILWSQEGPMIFDFDDMLNGPPVQDLWLLVPGRDEESLQRREIMLKAYQQMRAFDRTSLKAIELLRALRMINYSAWIARRQDDPIFKRTFPDFGSTQYWREQVSDLMEQIEFAATGL